MVGMWLAANAPDRIDRLVLICTAAKLPASAGYVERAGVVRAAGTSDVIADAVVARWFTSDFASEHPDLIKHHRAMIAPTPAEGYASCCEAIDTLDLRSDLPRIQAQTLVVAGADDPAAPPALGGVIADAIPGARFCLLERAAHLASVQRAIDVTRLIADHLESREAA